MIPAENIEDFGQWLNWVVARTQWNGKDEVLALKKMVAEFEAADYSAKEVTKATQSIFFNNSGNKLAFDPNVILTIIDIIQSERSREEKVQVEIRSGRFKCNDCKCEGLVQVPHPAVMRKKPNGDVLILKGTTAVCACRCSIGQEKLMNAASDKRFILQIEAYEQGFPGWKREMGRRYEQNLGYSLSLIGLTINEYISLDEEEKKRIFYSGAKGVGTGCTTTDQLKPLFPYLVRQNNDYDDMPMKQKAITFDAIENGRSMEEHLAVAEFS